MLNQQLLDYIKQQFEQGATREQIESSLLASGWQAQDIEEGFNALAIPAIPSQLSNFLARVPKLIWIASAFLIGAMTLTGVIYLSKQTSQSAREKVSTNTARGTRAVSEVLDCREDFPCLIQAATDCKKAKGSYSATVNIADIKQTTTSYYEIKGSEADRCSFYLRIEKTDLVFPTSTPQEVVGQLNMIYKKLEGRDGICKYSVGDLTSMLMRWEKGNF